MKIYLQSHDLLDPDQQHWLMKYAPSNCKVQQESADNHASPLTAPYSRFFVDLPDDIATLYVLRWA